MDTMMKLYEGILARLKAVNVEEPQHLAWEMTKHLWDAGIRE